MIGLLSLSLPPTPAAARSSEYRRMLDFIIACFPESKGDEVSARASRLVCESIFPSSSADPSPPLPLLNVIQRVQTALSDADERLAKNVNSRKLTRSLLPRRKVLYFPSGLPVKGKAVPVNQLLASLLRKNIPSHWDVVMSVSDMEALEGTFRSQIEVVSHGMWVFSGLLS